MAALKKRPSLVVKAILKNLGSAKGPDDPKLKKHFKAKVLYFCFVILDPGVLKYLARKGYSATLVSKKEADALFKKNTRSLEYLLKKN